MLVVEEEVQILFVAHLHLLEALEVEVMEQLLVVVQMQHPVLAPAAVVVNLAPPVVPVS